jgi:hypothetical protein
MDGWTERKRESEILIETDSETGRSYVVSVGHQCCGKK